MKENNSNSMGLQDKLLQKAMEKNKTVIITLRARNTKIIGRVKAHDRFAILIELPNGQEHMIFKHAILTIAFGR